MPRSASLLTVALLRSGSQSCAACPCTKKVALHPYCSSTSRIRLLEEVSFVSGPSSNVRATTLLRSTSPFAAVVPSPPAVLSEAFSDSAGAAVVSGSVTSSSGIVTSRSGMLSLEAAAEVVSAAEDVVSALLLWHPARPAARLNARPIAVSLDKNFILYTPRF